jgi:hypothetical protein
MIELTLRPSHLILDPNRKCLARTKLKLEEETYSLILSVMFTMVPVFLGIFPAINDRRYQATQVSMTTRIRVINERLIANNKNKKTESQERENLNRSFRILTNRDICRFDTDIKSRAAKSGKIHIT